MGRLEVLPNGNTLVGWGNVPAVTEFDPPGQKVYVAALGGVSYRAARSGWSAQPTTPPAIAARRDGYNTNV
jgi:hypothetical protein